MHISPSQTIWVTLILQFMDERNRKKKEEEKNENRLRLRLERANVDVCAMWTQNDDDDNSRHTDMGKIASAANGFYR